MYHLKKLCVKKYIHVKFTASLFRFCSNGTILAFVPILAKKFTWVTIIWKWEDIWLWQIWIQSYWLSTKVNPETLRVFFLCRKTLNSLFDWQKNIFKNLYWLLCNKGNHKVYFLGSTVSCLHLDQATRAHLELRILGIRGGKGPFGFLAIKL